MTTNNTHEVGLLVNGAEAWVPVDQDPATDESLAYAIARDRYFAGWDALDVLSAQVEIVGTREVMA